MVAPQAIMKVEGIDGQIALLKDRIILSRKGIFAIISHGFKGQKEIPLGSISTVEFKDASLFSQGHLSIVHNGARGDKKKGETSHNDNTVKFNKKQREQFIEIKERIFALINTK